MKGSALKKVAAIAATFHRALRSGKRLQWQKAVRLTWPALTRLRRPRRPPRQADLINTRPMVKIKQGYVMSPREREEYERQDALPRATSGTVAYYFKRQTKYPPRIYVFMQADGLVFRNALFDASDEPGGDRVPQFQLAAMLSPVGGLVQIAFGRAAGGRPTGCRSTGNRNRLFWKVKGLSR